MALTRRGLLQGGAAALAATALGAPRAARASVAPEDRKFIFFVVYRGWDPTRVFATEFENPNVAMEADAELGEVGGIRFVDHRDRPNVRSFFETWHARTLILNGLVVPSVGHSECLRLVMTGSNRVSAADWPALVGAARQDVYGLPHVVVRGPSFPGTASSVVTRVGTSGWVERVLDGSILDYSATPVAAPSAEATALIERYLGTATEARVARAASSRERTLVEHYGSALERGGTLRSLVGDVRWGGDTAIATQADLATDLLALGLARCVTLTMEDTSWDSHAQNDLKQSRNFETLFTGLNYLLAQLAATPGTHAETLADETVLVVYSEMGRTPHINGGEGKDHWSHTSAMMVGPGVTGDRVAGGFTELYYGEKLDPGSAEPADGGVTVYPQNMGATLLQLAGVDPAEALPDVVPITGLLT